MESTVQVKNTARLLGRTVSDNDVRALREGCRIVSDNLRKKGNHEIRAVDHRAPGEVVVRSVGWGGTITAPSGHEVSEFVEKQLGGRPDASFKPAKFCDRRKFANEAGSEGHQGHVFLQLTVGSDYRLQYFVSEDYPLHKDDLELPRGVSHVWTGSDRDWRTLLAWFPDRGW